LRSLFRLPAPSDPSRRGAPESTSAVLRHSQVRSPEKSPHPPYIELMRSRTSSSSSPAAISCRSRRNCPARLSPHLLCLCRVVPVLPVGPTAARQSLSGTRTGAQPTVHPAATIAHCRALALATIPLATRAATRGSVGQLEVRPPAVPLRFLSHFRTHPRRVFALYLLMAKALTGYRRHLWLKPHGTPGSPPPKEPRPDSYHWEWERRKAEREQE